MDPLTTAAASGLQARIDSLDMLANNLANTGSTGFKADREFYGSYLAPQLASEADPIVGQSPVVQRHWTDFTQGSLAPTGNATDVALSGSGFFTVNGPKGTLYTRSGSFHLDGQGTLVTNEGYSVRMTGGGTLTVQGPEPISIGKDGTVSQGSSVLGQFELADFRDPHTLLKFGYTYFQTADPKAQPDQLSTAEIEQARLEQANASPAESAARMMTLMRNFEMLQHAIKLGTEMNRHAVEEVARVS
jgi:flagellar basal body rod protein FlgG